MLVNFLTPECDMKLKRVNDGVGRIGWRFYCPGCQENHTLYVHDDRPTPGPLWKQTGLLPDRPTFQPSLIVTSGCRTPSHKPGDNCWCVYNAEQISRGEPPAPFRCGLCHLFLVDGMITFLGDCSHKLAGQVVELSDLPDLIS